MEKNLNLKWTGWEDSPRDRNKGQKDGEKLLYGVRSLALNCMESFANCCFQALNCESQKSQFCWLCWDTLLKLIVSEWHLWLTSLKNHRGHRERRRQNQKESFIKIHVPKLVSNNLPTVALPKCIKRKEEEHIVMCAMAVDGNYMHYKSIFSPLHISATHCTTPTTGIWLRICWDFRGLDGLNDADPIGIPDAILL